MPLPLALVAAAPGLIKAAGSLFGSGRRKRAERQARRQQQAAEAAVRNFEYSQDPTNPFANITNAFSDVTNTAEGLTNPYADLRVNTQQADFQAEQNAQSQANILDAIRQGGGNVGASATSLAAQATDANRQISADIGRQEAQNQQLSAQGEASRQQAFAQGEARRQQLFAQGLDRQQTLQAQGEQYVQSVLENRDQQRQSQNLFFLGRSDQQLAGAQQARQNSRNQFFSGLSSAVGGALGAGGGGGALGGLGGGGGAVQTLGGLNAGGLTDYSNFGSQFNTTVPNLGGY